MTAAGPRAAPSGTLTIIAHVAAGEELVRPILDAFMDAYPAVSTRLYLLDRPANLIDEGIDVALRIAHLADSTLVAIPIGEVRRVVAASPRYLSQHPAIVEPADLAHHACLTYAYSATGNAWHFRDADAREHVVRVQGGVHANNGQMLVALAAAGMGVALEPDFIVAPELASGALVPLLAGYAPAASSIYAVYASRRHLSAKVRAFVDFLAARFGPGAPMGV